MFGYGSGFNQVKDPDPDPGGQKGPTKIEKSKKFHVLKCWMFTFEGFAYSLDVLNGGLGIITMNAPVV